MKEGEGAKTVLFVTNLINYHIVVYSSIWYGGEGHGSVGWNGRGGK